MTSQSLARRHMVSKAFRLLCAAVTWAGVVLLGLLLFHVTREGLPWVDLQFLTDFPMFPRGRRPR